MKKTHNESDCNRMNRLITGTALRGHVDGLGPTDINWKVIGDLVFVYIDDNTGKRWCRLFQCHEPFHFTCDRLLYPSNGDGELRYVYGCCENLNGKAIEIELEQWEPGEWLSDIEILSEVENER